RVDERDAGEVEDEAARLRAREHFAELGGLVDRAGEHDEIAALLDRHAAELFRHCIPRSSPRRAPPSCTRSSRPRSTNPLYDEAGPRSAAEARTSISAIASAWRPGARLKIGRASCREGVLVGGGGVAVK